MTIITRRRNHRTGTEIALHREEILGMYLWDTRLFWSTECRGHGYLAEWDTRKEAERMMARPDEWCVGCIEGWEVFEKEMPQDGRDDNAGTVVRWPGQIGG